MVKRRSRSLSTLTKVQMDFIAAFIQTGDVAMAASIASPGCKSPAKYGNRLRDNPVVRAEIERARATMVTRLAMTQADVLMELSHIARFDPIHLVHPDGKPKKMHELDEATRRGMVDHEFAFARDGSIVLVAAKSGKTEALKTLGKHLIPTARHAKDNAATVFHLDVRFARPENETIKDVTPRKGAKVRAPTVGGRILDISMELPRGAGRHEEESE